MASFTINGNVFLTTSSKLHEVFDNAYIAFGRFWPPNNCFMWYIVFLCVFNCFYVMWNVFILFYLCMYFVRNDEIKLWYIISYPIINQPSIPIKYSRGGRQPNSWIYISSYKQNSGTIYYQYSLIYDITSMIFISQNDCTFVDIWVFDSCWRSTLMMLIPLNCNIVSMSTRIDYCLR